MSPVFLAAACLAFISACLCDEAPINQAPWHPGPPIYSVRVPGVAAPTISLYPEGGAVPVATGASLLEDLASPDSRHNWKLVEVYDRGCPHCWYAAPIVTDLARAFAGALGLSLATLNCHAVENEDVCFALELTAQVSDFPSFVLCAPEGDSKEHPALPQDLGSSFTGPVSAALTRVGHCTRNFVKPPGGVEVMTAGEIAHWIMEETHIAPRQPAMLQRGADFEGAAADPSAPPGRPGWLGDDLSGQPGMPAFLPQQRWNDALVALFSTLGHEYRYSRHKNALEAVDFLAKVMPVEARALSALSERLRGIGPQRDPAIFRANLAEWATEMQWPDPSNEVYATCTEMPCALWTLLHVAVTAASVRGLDALNATESGRPTSAPVSVDETMAFTRSFVDAFFSCRPCKEQFLIDFDSCAYGRCDAAEDWRGVSLWLWRVHNAVSLRVAAQQRAEVDRRWPMYQDCQTCWRRELVMDEHHTGRRLQPMSPDQSVSGMEVQSAFHEEYVYWYLVRTFVGLDWRRSRGAEDWSRAEVSPEGEGASSGGGFPGLPLLVICLAGLALWKRRDLRKFWIFTARPALEKKGFLQRPRGLVDEEAASLAQNHEPPCQERRAGSTSERSGINVQAAGSQGIEMEEDAAE